MKVQIKLKHTQLTSLCNLIEKQITDKVCEDRNEAIVACIMIAFYKKLKEKTVLIEPRNYSFSIPVEMAMAFVQFFETTPFDASSHAGNIAQKLIADFDQKTAKFY